MTAIVQKKRVFFAAVAMSKMCTGAQPLGVDVKHATLSYGHCLAPAKHL